MTEVTSQATELPVLADARSIVAFLWIDRSARAWNETIAALLRIPAVGIIHVGFAQNQQPSEIRKHDPRVILHEDEPLKEVAKKVFALPVDYVLFCTWPGRPSPETFDLVIDWMDNDPRIGTMSFLSNAAGALSFPHRNTGTPFGVDGHDEVSLTRLLRKRRQRDAGPTPIQVPDGAMVLVSRAMWDVCGALDDYGSENLSLALADLALRGCKRGFNNYLDSHSYVTMPWDDVGPFASTLLNADARHAIHQRHLHFPVSYDAERTRPHSVLAEALDSARARATGLRVLIDGSALGPKEMGTQLLILKLSLALAERDEIQTVVVGVPDPASVPAYAQELVHHRKIQLVAAGNLDFPGASHVDIIHRPYQPSSPIPWDRWRGIAKRSVITVQDLIAYRNAAYFQDGGEWLNYRDNFLRQVSQVDAVVSISHDVVVAIKEERLPIDSTRVHVVENGADARTRDQPTSIPDAVLERGWASSPFLFVLGATYAHKNRDLALRVWARLREKGYPHKLIMAGAAVPYGSARIEECLLTTPQLEGHVLSLPDVTAEERNWLLGNSSLAVYLTAAEGFGQIPFEAARLDVPSLYVSFGPLRELIEDTTLPVTYDVEGLVARAQGLLDDPVLARASIAGVLKNINQLTWAETARKTVDAYFEILNQPSRVLGI
jgi:glycosyltransferase involved in cell wall biosynthesis